MFGVSEASERLPIALAAMVLIGVAFLIGRAAYSVEAGLFSAIALALSPRFLMFSRRIIIDLYLAMFMGLTLLFFMLAERDARRRGLYLALMYASAGLGFLTKGPVAIALPAAVFFLYLIVTRRVSELRRLMLPAGALIIAALVLPWYTAIYLEHGWGYIGSFFLKDNLSRYTQPVWGPRRGPFYYIPVLIADLLPWSLFLIPALASIGRAALGKKRAVRSGTGFDERSRSRILLLLWMSIIVVFFSFSSNKEDLYILPAYTAASAIAGGFLSAFVFESKPPQPGSGRWATAALGLIISLAGASVVYLFGQSSTLYSIAGVVLIGYLGLTGGAVCAVLALFKKDFHALMGTSITVLAINWVFVLWALPDFERFKPVRTFCEMIKRDAPEDAMVGYYRFSAPSMVFYLGRPVFEYYYEDELRSAFSSGREVYAVMMDEDYEMIKGSLPTGTNILASGPVFQVKLRFILESRVPPQLVLVHSESRTGRPQ
jgi:4-amino-4-deoxy-L-arabinose transferase-like glycosyltransferase